jgi:tRNA U34 2-thiouridine synthase MnmA/TrmU
MFESSKTGCGHAVALFSGGLDSSLAIILVLKQNIQVTALTFLTHFGCTINDKSSCGADPYPVAEKFGFKVKLVHLGSKFINMVRFPRYGYGKNMNPCIDCRILMLKEAREFMKLAGADFVITGEIVGQRPKSQFKNSLSLVEKESGLEGYLVRPLSARLLPETIPERNGLLDRKLLEGISGRSRKRQLAMAEEFGLEGFSSPGGGCLLTDPQYSKRLRDLVEHCEDFSINDIKLLSFGRHFRLDKQTKLIVGRDKEDNESIRMYAESKHIMLEALGTGSPVALFISEGDESNLELAAAITARYSDLKREPLVEITRINEDNGRKLLVAPHDPEETARFLIK